jgi:hypothetical protein
VVSGMVGAYNEKNVEAWGPRNPALEGITEGVCFVFLAHRSVSLKSS